MTINYLEEHGFKIKGLDAVIAISDKEVSESDIQLSSNALGISKNPNLSKIPFLIDCAGEYEIKGVRVYGYQLSSGVVTYLIKIDGFTICFLPQAKKVLDDEITSELSETDILLFDLGKKEGINIETATEIISQIEPKVIIPAKGETVAEFLKAMGKENNKEVDKLTLKSPADLPKETEIFILKN
jgi:hypothetical protein